MSDKKEKMLVHIQDDGYCVNPNFPQFSKKYKHGEITCLALNRYYGREEIPDYLQGNEQFEKLAKALGSIRKSNIRKRLDPLVKSLPLLSTDRDHYKIETSYLFMKKIEIQYVWNKETESICEQVYAEDLIDLLLRDVKKVVDSNIPIYQCYCGRYFIPTRRGTQKYCKEHGKAGANKARYKNRKNDPAKYLYSKIYNRVLANSNSNMYHPFLSESAELLAEIDSGKITEEEYLVALQRLDDKYRVRKKRD